MKLMMVVARYSRNTVVENPEHNFLPSELSQLLLSCEIVLVQLRFYMILIQNAIFGLKSMYQVMQLVES